MQSLRDEHDGQMRKRLNDEQYKQYKEKQAEMRGKRKGGGKR